MFDSEVDFDVKDSSDSESASDPSDLEENFCECDDYSSTSDVSTSKVDD